MRVFTPILLATAMATIAAAQQPVTFPTKDGAQISADLYGKGDRAVVLLHGGRFNKGSWARQARELESAGFRVLAFDFRGYGQSKGPGQAAPMDAPLYLDVLGAIRYLRGTGAKRIFALGGSLGGGAASMASIESPGEIERLVLLGSSVDGPPEKLTGRKLFIMARDDASGDGPRLPGILAKYEKVPQPKEMILLEGSAHAQFLFATDQAERVMREILRFFSAP